MNISSTQFAAVDRGNVTPNAREIWPGLLFGLTFPTLGTGWAKINDDILSFFNANFPGREPTVEIAWPNIPFEPNPREEFVRIELFPGPINNVALGGSRKRRVGTITVQVFSPANSASEDHLSLVDSVIETFRGASISNFRLQGSEVVFISEDAQYYQSNIEIPFVSDLNTQ